MEFLKFLLKHSRKAVMISLLAGICSGACNAALLAVINKLLTKHSGGMELIALFAGLCLLLPVSRYISELLLNNIGQDSLYSLRLQISRQVLAAPLRNLEQLGIHRVLAALTEDLPVITNTAVMLPLICLNGTIIISCLVYIGLLSWKLLLILLLFMMLGIALYQLPILKAQEIFRRARKDGDALLNHFQALLHGSKELKLHKDRREAFFSTLLDRTASSFQANNKKAMKIYTMSAIWGQTLVFILVGLILIVFPASRGLSRDTLTGYTFALLYLMQPLQLIMNLAPNLARANVAIRNVRALGFQLSSQAKDTNIQAPPGNELEDWRELQFQAVTYLYRREDELGNFELGPLDVSFSRGQLVFITGGNGSGKTTFAKLLTGLYIPEQGEITLNGKISTRDPEQRETYRSYFSAVFSDFYLFDQLLGLCDEAVTASADTYLRQLGLAHKVKIENGALSTTQLSQGQRKRLALLTAYLEDRQIYVFDEWAADQDPYFKEVFYLHILPELKARGKTIFVLSHDDRYYYVADRLLKFEEGQIVSDIKGEAARGSHVLAVN